MSKKRAHRNRHHGRPRPFVPVDVGGPIRCGENCEALCEWAIAAPSKLPDGIACQVVTCCNEHLGASMMSMDHTIGRPEVVPIELLGDLVAFCQEFMQGLADEMGGVLQHHG